MSQDNTQNSTNEPVILRDTSSTGKVRPWRKQKMTSRAIAASMHRIWEKHPRKNFQFKKRATVMYGCSDYLVFGEHVDPVTGEVSKVLDAAVFCRDRLCPMCQWRKSIVTFCQLSEIMDSIDLHHPGEFIPVFLTLTMRNVTSEQLASGITTELEAWSRMMVLKAHDRKPRRVCGGWFRALEITYNAATGEWHPHIHAVLLMPADYFTDPAKYIDHDAWVQEWRWALRADYDPSVDVRTITNDRAHAVAEVSKYAVKPGEWVSDDYDATDERVELLANVLKGRRLVAFGGVMKETRKALNQPEADNADLVNTGEDEAIRGDLRIALDRYEWQTGITNDYVLASRETFDPSAAARD